MSSASADGKTAKREGPNLDSLYMIGPDGSRKTIHPADVRGRFQQRKKILWTLLIIIYVAMPWVKIGGRPAILIDIGQRQFFLFGATFSAQDFYLAFFFITGLAFTLYVVSAMWGRLWCGYACPQTVFLEGLFRRVERWFEGSAAQRQRLEKVGWTTEKVLRKTGKYLVYLVLSVALSHTFLSYFMPAEEVYSAMVQPPSAHPTAFTFILVFTAIIFGNFARFREQLCIIICPYGRFQSVLYDEHTINVGYDSGRGEPRGHHKEEGRGDCIDCFRCVSVCPTGIDIRNGTQLECIGCANCIDACDEVMDKLGQERGLVRYDSLAGFSGQPRKLFRPRTGLYGVLLVIGCVVFLSLAMRRESFEARLLRGNGPTYTVTENVLQNIVSLHLVNKGAQPIAVKLSNGSKDGVEVVLPMADLKLESFGDVRVPVVIRLPQDSMEEGRRARVNVEIDGVLHHREIQILGPR